MAEHFEVPGGLRFPCTVIALDLGGTKIAGALVRYEGRHAAPSVGERRAVPTMAAEGGSAVLARMVDLACGLAACVPPDAPLAGCGVSTAGYIDEASGCVTYANSIMPGWAGQKVGPALVDALGVPCAVMNDVRAYAFGELRHGAARGCDTCVVVAAGTGLGGAVIVHGKVLDGAHGFAGMVGHTLHPAALGKPSAWGTDGHLESVCAGSGIEACYRLAGGEELTGPRILGPCRRRRAARPLDRSGSRDAAWGRPSPPGPTCSTPTWWWWAARCAPPAPCGARRSRRVWRRASTPCCAACPWWTPSWAETPPLSARPSGCSTRSAPDVGRVQARIDPFGFVRGQVRSCMR